MKVPLVGWTFAEDFLSSKTSHLAFVAITTAVTCYQKHQFTLFQALILGFLSLAAAFLRDSHVKGGETIAWAIDEALHHEHYPSPLLDEAGDGGEADQVPVPASPAS